MTNSTVSVTSPLDCLVHMSQLLPVSSLGDPALLQLPGLTPPSGTAPNFTDPDNRGALIIIVNGILLAIMTVFIGIRAYTKTAIVRKLSWDDMTVSLSALGATALYGFLAWGKLFSFHIVQWY